MIAVLRPQFLHQYVFADSHIECSRFASFKLVAIRMDLNLRWRNSEIRSAEGCEKDKAHPFSSPSWCLQALGFGH